MNSGARACFYCSNVLYNISWFVMGGGHKKHLGTETVSILKFYLKFVINGGIVCDFKHITSTVALSSILDL